MEIDHEIISMAILLPSADSIRVVVSYKGGMCTKYIVLVNHLVKLVQEKSVARWTDHHDMIIAVDWDVKNHTKQTIIWTLDNSHVRLPLNELTLETILLPMRDFRTCYLI